MMQKRQRPTVELTVRDYLVSGETYQISQTAHPGILQTTPVPENLDAYYESERYISHTDGKGGLFERLYQWVKRVNLKRKVRLVDSLHGTSGKLLDVGAGTGDFLVQARSSGWEVSGTEPNDRARALAQKKGIELEAQLSDIGEEAFDCITLWHVLEHIREPEAVLSQLKSRLRPNGHLILALPNFQSFDAQFYKSTWAGYDVPRHLWHFSQDGVEALLRPIGFKVVQTRPMLFDSFYVSWLSEKYRQNPLAPLVAFFIGCWSNLMAMRSGEYSSLIYILKEDS